MARQKQLSLEDLPLELLIEIAGYLDFPDITALLQTSKILKTVTDASPLWIKLVQDYSDKRLVVPCLNSRYMTTMTIPVLRAWLTRCTITDEVWRKPSVAPHSIILDYPPRTLTMPSSVMVLPGGRWALVGGRHGWIHYYDLSHRPPTLGALISPTKNRSTQLDVRQIACHQQSPKEWIIAFSGMEKWRMTSTVAWIHIWQLGETNTSSLSATHLKSIPYNWTPCGYGVLSLTEDLLVRATFGERNMKWADIFLWKECDETRLVRSRIHLDCYPDFATLIGNDRLLVADPTRGLHLFNIPDLEPMSPEDAQRPPVRSTATPCWIYSYGHADESFRYSRLSFDGTSYRLAIGTPLGIAGLVIPPTKDKPPTIVNLFKTSLSPEPVGIGLTKARIIHDTGVAKLGYSWGLQTSNSAFSTCQHTKKGDSSLYCIWTKKLI